jgi:hypothetical protein
VFIRLPRRSLVRRWVVKKASQKHCYEKNLDKLGRLKLQRCSTLNHKCSSMKKQINPTIKAHLIRSAFYVILLLAVCVIPFALAQRNTNKRSVARPKPTANLAAAASRAAVPSTGAVNAVNPAEAQARRAAQHAPSTRARTCQAQSPSR